MKSLLSSYSKKITFLFLLLGILPIIGIGSFLSFEEIRIVSESIELLLTSESESFSETIHTWISERQNDVIDIASNKIIVSKTNLLVNSDDVYDSYNANIDLQTQSEIFLTNNPWFVEYVISDKDNNIIFSSNYKNPEDPIQSQIHFKNALSGKLGVSEIFESLDILKNEYGFYEQSLPTIWISYPIQGEVGINGILSARVDVFQIPQFQNPVTNYETFDTYLIDSNGYFITKPNSHEIGSLALSEMNKNLNDQYHHTIKIFDIVDQNQSALNLDGYENYVGDLVIGSVTPVKNTDWYVISEIHKRESDDVFLPTQIIFFNFISLSVLSVVGASVFLSGRIIEPVKRLKKATEAVSHGNFDIKLKPYGDDEISYLFESFNDMTNSLNEAKNRVFSSELKYKNLYDNAPDLYRTIDTDGRILDCNTAYATSLGYTKYEIIGKSIFDHVSKKDYDKLNDVFNNWKEEGNIKNKEIWLKRKDGSTFPTIINVSSVYDQEGKIIGSNTAIRDITELYAARKEIEDNKSVIEKQLEDLKQVDKAKDEFLAMITHELRTPLVPIQAYIEILLSEKLGPLNQTQKEKLKILESSSHSMLSLIKDLLDAQKLEIGQLKLEKEVHEISKLIEEVIDKLKPDSEKSGISITADLEKPVTCICDKSRISQVLTNLISNSMDFCPKNSGKITVKLRTENNQVKIIVKDNGIGIVKESLDKIFVKFYQADTSTTREHGGTGLGLSVCKGIIESHGGKIWAVSEGRNKGAEIHILLPADPSK